MKSVLAAFNIAETVPHSEPTCHNDICQRIYLFSTPTWTTLSHIHCNEVEETTDALGKTTCYGFPLGKNNLLRH